MAKKKIDILPLIAAAGAGAAYKIGLDVAAHNIDAVNKHYQKVKTGAAAVLGLAIAYLSNDKNLQAAGYGLLGIAGMGGGSYIAEKIPMNGPTNRVMARNLRSRPLPKLNAVTNAVTPNMNGVLPNYSQALQTSMYLV
jgi:hypothetical protein